MSSVFAYGTLQVGEVMELVAGRRFPGEPALLGGYRRRRILDRTYPGVVPHPGEDTAGIVFREVGPDALARLDRFEGDLYDRLALPVRTRSGEEVLAWTYVVKTRHLHQVSDHAWALDEFLLEHGEAFIESCRRLRGEPVE